MPRVNSKEPRPAPSPALVYGKRAKHFRVGTVLQEHRALANRQMRFQVGLRGSADQGHATNSHSFDAPSGQQKKTKKNYPRHFTMKSFHRDYCSMERLTRALIEVR